ncbi:MAG: hypothetical protein GVY14_00615 [Spirochaetes bacterium]|jgi:hypothetical protein|nr:hypothetical protein [Spirochaetota bacterium]
MNKHHVIGVLALVIGIATYALTSDLPTGRGDVHLVGPAFFPRILALILGAAGLWEITIGTVKAVRDGERPITAERIKNIATSWYAVNMVLIIALVVFFVLMFKPLGFVLTALIVVFVVMHRLGVPVLKNLFAGLVFVVVIYLLFGRLFTISLPGGVLSVIGL